MKGLKGNTKMMKCNDNIEDKKKTWLNSLDEKDKSNLKNVGGKSIKNAALTFFKEHNIYNRENIEILNYFCQEKLDDNLVDDEIIEFLQTAFFLFEYFIKVNTFKINKKEFIENVCDCCKRILLKNIIKYEKEILDFLLKNLINFINKYSFSFIYQSLYNIYQYQNKKFRKPNEYRYDNLSFILNIESVIVNNQTLLVNNNEFLADTLLLLDENDEKYIKEKYSTIRGVCEDNNNLDSHNNGSFDIDRQYNFISNDLMSNDTGSGELEKDDDKEDDESNDGTGKKTRKRTRATRKGNKNNVKTSKKKDTILKQINDDLSNIHKINKANGNYIIDQEFVCLYMFAFFKGCFDNINFYLIEKFIENYYMNENKENIYKELFLFLFLIYKDKMHNIINRILTDTIKSLNNSESIDIRTRKKKKINNDDNSLDTNCYISDCLFYYELLISIITYNNLQYENNYEYYINILKLLNENDNFQNLFIHSFFFVYISTKDVNIRSMLLINFVKYHSKKHHILLKLLSQIKNIFALIYDINSNNIIYNINTFNQMSISDFMCCGNNDELKVKYSYLFHIAENIIIDKYIDLFFKETYYIISRINLNYFCHATNLYLCIYDKIFNKTINIIYENEMNLNDEAFSACKKILKPFLFIYVELFDSLTQKLKKNIFDDKVMFSFSFIKKYLLKNMYERTYLQKDLFGVIYQIYFFIYTLKYKFINFLKIYVETKRNIKDNLEDFLKLKIEYIKTKKTDELEIDQMNYLNMNDDDDFIENIKNDVVDNNKLACLDQEECSNSKKNSDGDIDDDSNNQDEEDSSDSEYSYSYMYNNKRKNKKENIKSHEKKTISKKIVNKKDEDKKENKKNDSDEDEEINKNLDEYMLMNIGQGTDLPCNQMEMKKIKIINFFQKHYLLLKYFDANVEQILEEYCTDETLSKFSSNTCTLEGNSNNIFNGMKDNGNSTKSGNLIGKNKHITVNPEDRIRFIKKLRIFFDKNTPVDEIINSMFINNKDNVYSKILKNNLIIIKEFKNLRLDVIYPIFNASLALLFDDFYFFIIQNIKLVVEEKERCFSDYKIFLNISFILLHMFAKDIKIEKYLVSIFYMLKLSLNKLRSIEIFEENEKESAMDIIYNKDEKAFRNNIKYYNLKKENTIFKNISEEEAGQTSLESKNKENSSLHKIEEKMQLHQNILYIFLKLLQNILRQNNLYYNFKSIIYDILFSEYSNKKIVFSSLKCVIDKYKLEEVYNYCLTILDSITVEKNHILYNIINNDKVSLLEPKIGHNDSKKDENDDDNNIKAMNEQKQTNKNIKQVNKNITQNYSLNKRRGNKKDQNGISNKSNNMDKENNSEVENEMNENNGENTDGNINKGRNNLLLAILQNTNELKKNIFYPKNGKNPKLSSLYINLLILYYVFSQKAKYKNQKRIYYNSLKTDISNCYNIINKLLCIFYHNDNLNLYYHKYLKFLCLKIFKKIYNLFSIKEVDLYIDFLKKGNKIDDKIYDDKNINDIICLKNEIISFYEYILNEEVEIYTNKNGNKINNKIAISENYKFYFVNNLKCDNIVLKNDNFIFMINSLLFIFNIKYDKITFYKIVSIILMERPENRNYILEKVVSSIKNFFNLSDIYNNLKKTFNKNNQIRLPNYIENHSMLLYIIRTTILIFLLIDYNHINKQDTEKEDYISYNSFKNDYIKKKSIKYYYTQLNLLLFRVFYNEKNIPYFFKIFFSTLYFISFKKSDENIVYFFERVFDHRENNQFSLDKDEKSIDSVIEALANKRQDENAYLSEKSEELESDENIDVDIDNKSIKTKHNAKKNKQNKKHNEKKQPLKNNNKKRKKKSSESENSEETDEEILLEDFKKDYHKILRNKTQKEKAIPNDSNEKKSTNNKNCNNNDKDYKKRAAIIESSEESSSDSDVSYKINLKNNKKKKTNNKKNAQKEDEQKEEPSISSSDEQIVKENENDNESSDVEEKNEEIKKQREIELQTENEMIQNNENPYDQSTHQEMEDPNKIYRSYQFNGSLCLKIFNHFIFLCKGYHEDLELKIYNGVVTHLKENNSDREKLKKIIRTNYNEYRKNPIKYKKKIELLNIIETKIIFLNFIKENLKKRKSLISRISEVNLNIFKNKSMFHIELDLI
ncbi:hypothetical protein YYG_02458 [Plasmodium vinckei petteri]|uniref:Uncharacterized protein n=1 Tax=Plasmodium vinckei petteri TaxID=138298 RepID=W7AGP9_PLAVN|nr:hypothetical protein YYG_02458 [Plasmodium vinckei petteri]CAD2109425.1 conserved Plasmodium protein, unknown function [Plasmodium vinckei petteri]